MTESAARVAGSSQPLTEPRQLGAVHRQSWPIYLDQPVLDAVLRYSAQVSNREAGGFLIGQPVAAPARRLEIRHFVPAVAVDANAASLRFTHDTWSQLHQQIARNFPNCLTVGWHHTHPNLGVFLSAKDLFIHRHFFRQPWQVALVVDPLRQEFSFFQWRGQQVVDCGFFLAPSQQARIPLS